jgi:hypothetical protein
VGESAEAAAYVWSRAPKIVDAFDRGVVIRSARGLFLAIPTAAADKSGRSAVGSREKITPEGWQRRTGLKLGSSIAVAVPRCWSRMMPGSTRAGLPPAIAARPARLQQILPA